MKGKSIIKLGIAILLIGFLVYVALFDTVWFNYKSAGFLNKTEGINQGIDLAGGSVITFDVPDGTPVTNDNMITVEKIFYNRLTSQGYTEARVIRSASKLGRVTVEIPSIKDPEAAEKLLGQMARLTFVDSDGKLVLDGGNDISGATYKYGATDSAGTSKHYVEIKLKADAVQKFSDATARMSASDKKSVGTNFIEIRLDDTAVSAPRVDQRIDSETCIISGNFTKETASTLAAQIQSGNLPFKLNAIESSSVGPELGAKALNSSLLAALIGILIILLFMLIMYRIPGLIADIALICYIAIMAFIISKFRINLSLPGIAGIILSIGMAVDANVIIFERIKEELRTGKTLRAAIDAGFNRAWTAIIDGNITTLIAAVVLYFSTGSIKGFAITLGLGIIVSMFTAIVITKFLLKQLVGLNVKNPKLYGI